MISDACVMSGNDNAVRRIRVGLTPIDVTHGVWQSSLCLSRQALTLQVVKMLYRNLESTLFHLPSL